MLRHLNLRSTPRRVPASAAVSRVNPPPPLFTLGLCPGPCQPLGGLPAVGPYVSLLPLYLPPFFLLLIMTYYGSWFLVGWMFFDK